MSDYRASYRSGLISYASITLFVVLAVGYLLLATRFDAKIQQLDVVVGDRAEAWRKLSAIGGELVDLSEKENLPRHVQIELQEKMKLLLGEEATLKRRESELVVDLGRATYAFASKKELTDLIDRDVKTSVQRYVHSLAETPGTLIDARYTSLHPLDAVLLKTGAALDPIVEKERGIAALHVEIINRRVPMVLFVLGVLLVAVWSSWFWLLRPSLKQARMREQQIIASEERSRVTLNSIGDAVIVTDADGKLESMNPVAQSMLGYDLSEIYGKPIELILKLHRVSDNSEIENPVRQVLKTGSVVGLELGAVLRDKSGGSRLIADAAAPIIYPDGKIEGAIVVFRDVTEEQALREQLIRSEKLRAVGVLAGGMAHEFNNALAIISGAFELIKAGSPPEENGSGVLLRHFEIIDQAVKRSSSLTNRLLAIGRKVEIALMPVDLLKVIDEAVEILRRTNDRSVKIDVHCVLDESDRIVFGDASALQSVFINLGLNSIQSIEGGGRIAVFLFAGEEPRVIETGRNRFVKVVWQDNGHGIESQDIDRIFEPFYTTKSGVGGSGLGLSVIQSTITGHGGVIEVESVRNSGTTFTIHLPTTEMVTVGAPSSPADGTARAAGRVLIIDDETCFLQLVSEYLVSRGYKTLTSSGGIEALDIFDQYKDEIDVVVLDMNMPEISGPSIAGQIYSMRPDCKIIISSGYAKADLKKIDLVNMTYLKKPYEFKDLAKAINGLLGVANVQRP